MSRSIPEPRSILIVLHGAIGDVTRALPLATRIKRHWPTVHLAWGVEPISRPLVDRHPAIDEVIVFQRSGGLRAFFAYTRELRSRRFDLVLDLQRHFKSGVTSMLSRARTRIGFHPRNAKEFNWLFNTRWISPVIHFSPKIEYYQRFGDLLGLPELRPLDFGLHASDDEQAKVDATLDEAARDAGIGDWRTCALVALIVGSTWPSRFWSVEHYATVVESLYRSRGIVSVVVGARSERAFTNELRSRVAVPMLDLVEQTNLRELLAVFRRVGLAIGSDSGPMHIAAATGTPVVSLWGSTSAERSAPYGSEDLRLESPIGCSPCFRRECPGLGTLCMRDLPPAAVLGMVEHVLTR
ncbi:MAG: glycosyltransferase family 9 protein [Bdellovibrionales bacterium]|nr:glycosyltransferase family 9 protein [Bdellovibrionales bacterium]